MKNIKLTPFQLKVLKQTAKIPLGQIRSYKWVAEKIGHPKAMRAVGSALKKNPLPLLIPCHRVVKSDGKVGKYSGGSEKKKMFLVLEQELLRRM